jgi:hypothetical protein
MFISFNHLIAFAIIIIGILWCKEIFARLPNDIKKIKKTKDPAARFVIVLFWVITAGFILFAVVFIWGLVYRILHPMG